MLNAQSVSKLWAIFAVGAESDGVAIPSHFVTRAPTTALPFQLTLLLHTL